MVPGCLFLSEELCWRGQGAGKGLLRAAHAIGLESSVPMGRALREADPTSAGGQVGGSFCVRWRAAGSQVPL